MTQEAEKRHQEKSNVQREIRAIRAQEMEKQRKEDEEKEKNESSSSSSRFNRPAVVAAAPSLLLTNGAANLTGAKPPRPTPSSLSQLSNTTSLDEDNPKELKVGYRNPTFLCDAIIW